MFQEPEDFLDRELKQLPPVTAPVTLLPRVLAAVAELETTPWYVRGWTAWPRGLQAAWAVLLVLVVAGLWRVLPHSQSWVPAGVSSSVSRAQDSLEPVAHLIGQASTLGRTWWQVGIEPLAIYFLVLMVLLSAVCAAFWTAINRVALGGASPQ